MHRLHSYNSHYPGTCTYACTRLHVLHHGSAVNDDVSWELTSDGKQNRARRTMAMKVNVWSTFEIIQPQHVFEVRHNTKLCYAYVNKRREREREREMTWYHIVHVIKPHKVEKHWQDNRWRLWTSRERSHRTMYVCMCVYVLYIYIYTCNMYLSLSLYILSLSLSIYIYI